MDRLGDGKGSKMKRGAPAGSHSDQNLWRTAAGLPGQDAEFSQWWWWGAVEQLDVKKTKKGIGQRFDLSQENQTPGD